MFLSIKLSLTVFGELRAGFSFVSLSRNVSKFTEPQIISNEKIARIFYVFTS